MTLDVEIIGAVCYNISVWYLFFFEKGEIFEKIRFLF